MREVDAAHLPLMLTALRLPTISRLWPSFAEQADREGWGAARYLAALCEHELAERATRRIARHLAQSGLPPGKTFATFEFAAVPTLRKAQVSRALPGPVPRGRRRGFRLRRRDRGSDPVADMPATGPRCRPEPGQFGLRRA